MFSTKSTRSNKVTFFILIFFIILVFMTGSVVWTRAWLTNLGLVIWQHTYFLSTSQILSEQPKIALSFLQDAGQMRSYRVEYAIGDMYWRHGEVQLAVQSWEQADIHSQDFVSQAYLLYASSLFDSRQILDQQLRLLTIANSLGPEYSDALFFKAFLTRHINAEQSADSMTKALRLNNWQNPGLGLRLNNQLGMEKLVEGDRSHALDDFDRAIKIGETGGIAIEDIELTRVLANSYRQQGLLLQANGDIAAAQKAFERSIEIDNTNYWNYLSLVFIFETQKYSEADILSLFDRAIQVAPDLKWPYIKAADFFRLRGNVEKKTYYCGLTPRVLQSDREWISVCSAM